mmetsp:Transcript_2217/g.2834  ORF Transcript_2217/g.2834 Transcript_2217/m.2834 type:complete len:245 (+) Transcript_2217:1-735(+)
MRSQAKDLSDKLVALLKNDAISIRYLAAEGFGTVIRSCEEVLNKNSHAKESFLFKQRFFKENFAKLSNALNKTTERQHSCGSCTSKGCELDSQTAYLFALSRLLEYVPKSIMLSDLNDNKILPILVMALGSQRVEVKVSALATLSVLVNEAVEAVEPHLHTLIPLFLQVITLNSKHNKIKVKAADRARAIDCLSEIAESLPYHQIHPFKKMVDRGIIPALDDRKRAVRSKAVQCKNQWLTLQNQ